MYRILMKFLPKRPEKYTGRNIKNLGDTGVTRDLVRTKETHKLIKK